MMARRSDVSYVRSDWLETEVVRWNGELECLAGDPIAATNVRSASAPAVHGVSS